MKSAIKLRAALQSIRLRPDWERLCIKTMAILMLPLSLFAQPKSYSLVGTANAKFGPTYLYAISFETKGTSLTGYSVTKQPSGAEFKAEIKGHINRKDHTIIFSETKSLDKDPHNELTICLFDATLKYKQLGTKYQVAGTFTGRDLNNEPCTNGTMNFETQTAPANMFHTEKKSASSTPTKTDTIVKEQVAPLPDNTITAGVQKQIEWNSDSCTIEVWDGGVIDGDIVTILLNDAPMLSKYTLAKAHKQLRVALTQTTNTITVVAEDEGINPPNTAELSLQDGSINHRMTAFNKKGEKAVIVIKKISSK